MEAKQSAAVLRRHTDTAIALVAHRYVDSHLFDTVIIDESPLDSYGDKPRNLLKTPYERTIYLDTDVYMLSPVPELFEMLEQADVATTIDPSEYELRILDLDTLGELPQSMPIYQTGIIAYCPETASDFIERWEAIHTTKDIERDQVSFREALYKSDISHYALADVYNCLTASPMQVTGEVKFLHDTSDLLSIARDDYAELDTFAARVNETIRRRIFVSPYRGRVYMPSSFVGNLLLKHGSRIVLELTSFRGSLSYLFQSIKNNGIKYTVNQVLNKISR